MAQPVAQESRPRRLLLGRRFLLFGELGAFLWLQGDVYNISVEFIRPFMVFPVDGVKSSV